MRIYQFIDNGKPIPVSLIYTLRKEHRMPTIKVPSNVFLTDPTGAPVKDKDGFPVEIDFVNSFLSGTVLNDPKWGKDVKGLYAAMDLREMFKNTSAGSEVVVSQDLWEKLKEVVSEPSSPYNVAVMTQCKPFLDAVMRPEKA
jgi:hypothetical protein